MEMYADEGDIQRCVQTAIRVAAYQYADYTEMTVSYFSTSFLPNTFNGDLLALVSNIDCTLLL